MAEPETTKHALAGWIGGAVGIVVSNPLEVLKVRLQTHSPSQLKTNLDSLAFSRSPKPVHHSCNNPSNLALLYSIPPSNAFASIPHHPSKTRCVNSRRTTSGSTFSGLRQLWRQEGYRFLFAGAAAPILGLAFIDSFFFATYGECMSIFHQDRERPAHLQYVFASGAIAGGACALLQTPIEVIKCRAQADHLNEKGGARTRSTTIARRIYQRDGFRGFYLGGFTTGLRDSISSGIFFTSYAVAKECLRALRRTENVQAVRASTKSPSEVADIMLAGGIAGIMSALLPYPLDIIKTRLQVQRLSASSTENGIFSPSSGSLTSGTALWRPSLISQITRSIYAEGKNDILPNLHSTRIYRVVETLLTFFYRFHPTTPPPSLLSRADFLRPRRKAMRTSLRLGSISAFYRGLKPTLLSSFVGSAVTMGIFESVFDVLGRCGVGTKLLDSE